MTRVPSMELLPLADMSADPGWHDAGETHAKLTAAVNRFGQLRPIVLRRDESGAAKIVDGRLLADVLRGLGNEEAWAIDLGPMDATSAARVALALEVRQEVDYVELSKAVAALSDAGVTASELASCSPFTAVRIGHLSKLATFDWNQFKPATSGQHGIDWDASEAPLTPRASAESLPAGTSQSSLWPQE